MVGVALEFVGDDLEQRVLDLAYGLALGQAGAVGNVVAVHPRGNRSEPCPSVRIGA